MQDNKSHYANTINILYNYFQVYTDTALAEKLNTTRSAVAQWRFKKTIPKKILTKYGYIITGAEKKEKPQTKRKGSSISIDHYEKLIDLQDEKISALKKEIERLCAIVLLHSKDKAKPAFHFKAQCKYDITNNECSENIVSGNTSMTGYTENELSIMSAQKWLNLYHPDSKKDIIRQSEVHHESDLEHNTYNQILWKAKDGVYKMYNIEVSFLRKEGLLRSYYYWVNGDIQGES